MQLSDNITIGQLREMRALLCGEQSAPHPYKIGEKYFIRTVTHHQTGILRAVTQQELVLAEAAWIADDGNLTEALKTGNFNEVEMFPTNQEVIIGRGSIIDATIIPSIPTSRK